MSTVQMSKAAKAANKQPVNTPARFKPSYIILLILAVTLLIYAPIFSDQKEFTNWDDNGYVTDQPLIRSLDGDNIVRIFAPSSIVEYNYHPLTVLSLAIDYARAYDEDDKTLSITPFVVTNLILHLVNTLLVFMLIYRISNRQLWVAALTAGLFGIHPMHVESVAWISARKDLLYCMFFLLSLISYLKYTDSNRPAFLGLSLLLFIGSCLSKAMAVPLPFVLLLTDFLLKRKFTVRVLLEKVPFLIVALIIGLGTMSAQEGAITGDAFTIGQRILIASYAFCMYCLKLILPINLSAYYPYPDFNALPFHYYLGPVIAVAIAAIPVVYFIRKKAHSSELVWGVGFFILMILLVLQLITVGSSTMNDRYTYVSYIGLFFVLSLIAIEALKNKKYKNIVQIATVVFIGFCAVQSYARIPVWDNSKTLWTDVIAKYPIEKENDQPANLSVKTAYKNLGDYYATHEMFDSAFVYYKVLTDNKINDPEVWSNIGNIYVFRNDLNNAVSAFSMSISLDSTNYETYFKRGIIYSGLNRMEYAERDMDHVLKLKPDHKEASALREKFKLASSTSK